MPSQQNKDQIKVIEEKISRAKNVILTDYAGLNVAAQTALRAKVSEAGGEFSVSKNTLIKIALQNTFGDLPEEIVQVLNGPTAILYGFEDAVGATKATVDFTKENEALEIKAGLLINTEDKTLSLLTLDNIINLATLPSRDELRAKLIGQLQSPVYGLVNVMAGNLRGLVNVLDAVRKQKDAN